MESLSTIPLTVVLSILTSFLFQHIRLLTELINETYLANIEKEYRVGASTTYNMSLDTYGTVIVNRAGSVLHTFHLRMFGIDAVDHIAYFMLECIQGKFILDKNIFILLYIVNYLFPCPVLGGIGLQMVNKEHHALPPFSLKVMLTVPPLT